MSCYLTTRAILAFCLEALRLRSSRYRSVRYVTAQKNGRGAR